MHAMVDDGNRLQLKVAHTIDLQLKGKSRLQVPIDEVLFELVTHNIRGNIYQL